MIYSFLEPVEYPPQATQQPLASSYRLRLRVTTEMLGTRKRKTIFRSYAKSGESNRDQGVFKGSNRGAVFVRWVSISFRLYARSWISWVFTGPSYLSLPSSPSSRVWEEERATRAEGETRGKTARIKGPIIGGW
jgi:hypothetical protein